MNIQIEESWKEKLSAEFEKPYFTELVKFVHDEYAHGVCYPPGQLIFNAFNTTPFNDVKVVILGQDPYHGPGQAQGLCFSVPYGIDYPPSLKNIIQEVRSEYPESQIGVSLPIEGEGRGEGLLSPWAKQGVFLLNTCLTVRAHQAFSHSGHGWETFTDAVIETLSREREGLVFLLWGAPAGKKAALIDASKHLVLRSAHPSPLSAYRGFFENRHFIQTNEYLTQHGKQPILW